MDKTMTPRMKLDKCAKEYILSCIDSDAYMTVPCIEDKDKLTFLYETFITEYDWAIERYGEQKAFSEWLSGLPSSFNIAFLNYDILELAKSWGYYAEPMTEKQEQKVLDNWFNMITVKTFQLFRKYKVVA